MGKLTKTTTPVNMPSIEHGVCPECGHDALGKRDWLERLFRMRPTCPVEVGAIESGVGMSGPCSCSDNFHR